MTETRKITVNALTRVEGEGALYVRVRDDCIESVELAIYEPPRFFESLLRGRSIEDVPDITARICGICPVAYQMTAVHALENALSVEITPATRELRRLLYCAEWIESHVLHIIMLNAPDYFSCDSVIELAATFPDRVNDGLRIKKTANHLLSILGGRAIHPINVRIGGFYRLPETGELLDCLADLRWALRAATEMVRWIATFDYPNMEIDCEMVSLRNQIDYPMNNGAIASSKYASVEVEDYESCFSEKHVSHSTALQSGRNETRWSPYLLGPLARLEINSDQLFGQAQILYQDLAGLFSSRNRFHAIIARSIEVVHAIEIAVLIIEKYERPSQASVRWKSKSSSGCAATEAPRGMIYHGYQIDSQGAVVTAKIVPPTSQNQQQIESDIRQFLPRWLGDSDEKIASECEKLIRTYDPCISCSTHFLKLDMVRQ